MAQIIVSLERLSQISNSSKYKCGDQISRWNGSLPGVVLRRRWEHLHCKRDNHDPRNTNEEEPLTVATEDLIIIAGTPIVCHGLGISSHLNGKIGDLRSWDEATDCHEVHFEDEHLEPRSVKPENIRIIFELPEEAKDGL